MRLNDCNRRIEWIDLCKFIAIFYLVWGHVGISTLMDKYIHVFHMPMFFFLSGYIFNLNHYISFKDFVIKKMKSLLIPYFFFAIAIYYFWTIIYKTLNNPMPETQLVFWKGLFTFNTVISPLGSIQWFLTSLFLVQIMFYIIIKIVKENRISLSFILIIFSIIGYLYSINISIRLYWAADTALTAFVFYGVGYLLKNINNKQIKSFVFVPTLFKIFIFFIISITTSLLNEYVNMRTLQFGNFFLYYMSSISSIIMYVMLAMYVCKIDKVTKYKLHRWLLYIGQNTIVVLVLNNFYIQLVGILLYKVKIYKFINNENLNQLLLTIVIIILMIPSSYVLNKYIPSIIGRKKNRIPINTMIN